MRVTAHVADVSDEAQVLRFRDEAAKEHGTDEVHLLFNNAGIAGGGSLFRGIAGLAPETPKAET